MYIKKFVIKNFRAFDEEGITLIFNKGVNAIIGENNSGKSAVIDAIRIAYSTVTYNKDIFFYNSDFHVDEDGQTADYAQFDVYLEDVPKRLVEIWDPESETGLGGEFHIRFESVNLTDGRKKVKTVHWGMGTEGNRLSSDTFEAIDMVFLGALRDSENEMKPSRHSKLAQLLRNLVPEEKHREELVEVLSGANSTLLKKEQLQKTRNTINSNLSQIEQGFLSQQVDIGLVEPRFDSIASSLRAWVKPKWILIKKTDAIYSKALDFYNKHNTIKKIQKADVGIYFEISILDDGIEIEDLLQKRIEDIASKSFELYQNGLGYNNLLFMSAVLGDMAIIKKGIYQNLLLIEEPEAHLHPQLQELVHNFLMGTNQEDVSIQIIYTSHSPTLASKIDLCNVNLIYENNHKKVCLPFSKANLTDSDKSYLHKYLDVTKSQMFFAKGIIFVEGISEAILIPEMAKMLGRPLDKYAVEIVNVGSLAFKPFINLFSSDGVKACFPKIAIVTDDDRCADKTKGDYIDKNLDYDDINKELSNKLVVGNPSERCADLISLCSDKGIKVFSAIKTLEYALCESENNIYFMVEAIKSEFPKLGSDLEKKVKQLTDIHEKAACIWLFIRTRDKCKGAVAQYISQIINQQGDAKNTDEDTGNAFDIPEYLKQAIYCVTEK